MHAIILAGQIPGGPYPPPAPNFTWLAWVIVAVLVLCALLNLAGRAAKRGRRR